MFVYNKNNSKVRNWLNVCARERVSERVQCVINLWLKILLFGKKNYGDQIVIIK